MTVTPAVAVFALSLLICGSGTLALAMVCFWWRVVSKYYDERISKFSLAIVRCLAAISAAVPKLLPGGSKNDPEWYSIVSAAAVGYVLWEVVGLIGDSKNKKDDRITQQRYASAVRQAIASDYLLVHLRRLVKEKLQRVCQIATQFRGTSPTVTQIRNGLKPDSQVNIALDLLASLFRIDAYSNNNPAQQFRTGLFISRNGQLEIVAAFDSNTNGHRPFTSATNFASRYSLENVENPSHAVRCLQKGEMIIVEDCWESEKTREFEFFHDGQRQYLRSMVAYPVDGFTLDGMTPCGAAILIDTNTPKFFLSADRDRIRQIFDDFAARIRLEYAIKGLMEREAGT